MCRGPGVVVVPNLPLKILLVVQEKKRRPSLFVASPVDVSLFCRYFFNASPFPLFLIFSSWIFLHRKRKI